MDQSPHHLYAKRTISSEGQADRLQPRSAEPGSSIGAHTPPIGAECPEPDCDWITYDARPGQVVFAHLVEKHGYIDTTAHVLAHEASTPADREHEADSGHVSRRH